jgi:probable F420-dependent oxidoreductase
MTLQTVGVWAAMDVLSASRGAGFVRTLESLGYDTLWIPEGMGREVFGAAAWLLSNTTTLTIASGIANIYARDGFSAAASRRTLNEQWDGRFLLGLGVSHVPLVEGLRHGQYGKPVPTMRAYLEAMEQAPYGAPEPERVAPLVLAALGPLMLALARDKTDGAHPYNSTPDHTAEAREILGTGKLLCVEQAAILQTDPAKARALGRQFLHLYLGLPNSVNMWKRLGLTDADMAGGGSDRLVDAVIAWGDEKAIRRRIDEHLQAGADQVCVQALGPVIGGMCAPDLELLQLLAPTRADRG